MSIIDCLLGWTDASSFRCCCFDCGQNNYSNDNTFQTYYCCAIYSPYCCVDPMSNPNIMRR